MAQLHDNREISIVVSPTFRDVQEEREYLMGTVLPRLMLIAEERQVTVQTKWNTPMNIEGIEEILISLDIEESRHPYTFVRREIAEVDSHRHDENGVVKYTYASMAEFGYALEKSFVRLLDKVFPRTNIIELEKALVKAAKIYMELGQLEDALMLEERAVRVLKENIGEKNTDCIEAIYACGWLNYKLKRYDEALKILNHVHEIAVEVFGDIDPRTTDYIGVIRMVEASAKRAQR